MNAHLRIAIGVMVTLAATVPARAEQAEPAEARGPITEVRPADHSLTIHIGDEVRVDDKGNFVKAGSDLLLHVDESSQIRWRHQKAQLENLKVRDLVFVRYRTADRHLLQLDEAATLEDLKREVGQAMKQLRTCTHAQRDDYHQRIKGLIDLIDATMSRLKQSLSAEAQKRYEADLRNLQRRHYELNRLRYGIGPINAEGWELMKPGISSTLKDLNDAVDQLQAHVPPADK